MNDGNHTFIVTLHQLKSESIRLLHVSQSSCGGTVIADSLKNKEQEEIYLYSPPFRKELKDFTVSSDDNIVIYKYFPKIMVKKWEGGDDKTYIGPNAD